MTPTLNNNHTIKVGVVDDVPFVASSLKNILNSKGGIRNMFAATSGAEALQILATTSELPVSF